MKRREFIAGLLCLPLTGHTKDKDARQQRCDWLKARLRHLDARLRAGYRASEGRRLRARRRELAKERFRACR
jgi:hypothetical protein